MRPPLRKVRSGDPLSISAASFNTFIDGALDRLSHSRSLKRESRRDYRQTGLVLVRNESGAARSRFDVLGIAGPIIDPSDNANAFRERVAVRGVAPTSSHAGKFVVLLEPLVSNAIGLACVAGVCVARIEIANSAHQFADVLSGDATKLRSVSTGAARILWASASSGTAECIIYLGTNPAETRVVRVKKDGGAAGDATTACSWTYSIYDRYDNVATGTPLATGLAPLDGRTSVGKYTYATDGSYGLVFWDGSAWQLIRPFGERPDTDLCNP